MKKITGVIFFLSISAVLSLCACSLGTEQVRINYVAEHPQEKPGKGEVIIVKKAVDFRPSRGLVGGKKNNLGLTAGKLRLRGQVELSSIISTEVADNLNLYGYTVRFPDEKVPADEAASAKVMETRVLGFWTESVPEFGDVLLRTSEELEFELKDYSTGKTFWKTRISDSESEKINKGEAINYEKLANRVHSNVMKRFEKMISSPEFMKAAEGK